MVYKQVLIPDKENHTIEMPENFYGKKVEVIVIEVDDRNETTRPTPPTGKQVNTNELFENFGKAPDFPSSDSLRQNTWPSKW